MRRILLVLVSLLLVASACGDGGTEDIAAPGENGDGAPQVVESTDDELPANFPDDIPLPEPNTVIYSVVHDQSLVVFFDADLDYAALRAHWAGALPSAGWVLNVCQETEMAEEPTTVIIASKVNRMATVMIGYVELPQARFQGRYAFNVSVAEVAEPIEVEEPATC